MSLILDALKKAEAERQRHSGPTLLEVRVTPPRRRLPLWTVVIGGLLALNMVLLLVFALRRPVSTTSTTPAPLATPVTAAPAAPAPVAATAAASPAGPSAGATTAAMTAPAPATAPTLASPQPATANGPDTAAASGGAAYADSNRNPADDEPAIPARAGTVRSERDNRAADRASDRASSGAALPNLADLGGDMPNLRLDLHVYADRPASRYALINMHSVHEGDVLPEGPTVVEIYRDGVELSYHGTLFMLRPQ
jgi:general secretion pathway protein B